jgi:hypothetical protein
MHCNVPRLQLVLASFAEQYQGIRLPAGVLIKSLPCTGTATCAARSRAAHAAQQELPLVPLAAHATSDKCVDREWVFACPLQGGACSTFIYFHPCRKTSGGHFGNIETTGKAPGPLANIAPVSFSQATRWCCNETQQYDIPCSDVSFLIRCRLLGLSGSAVCVALAAVCLGTGLVGPWLSLLQLVLSLMMPADLVRRTIFI